MPLRAGVSQASSIPIHSAPAPDRVSFRVPQAHASASSTGFVCRKDQNSEPWQQVFRLWEALLHRHSAVSPVVQQLSPASVGRVSRQLLQRLSDTLAVRYLSTVSTFIDSLEDMRCLLQAAQSLSQAVVFDALMMMVEGQGDP